MAEKNIFDYGASSQLSKETKNQSSDDHDGVKGVERDEKTHQFDDKGVSFKHCRSEPLVAFPCLSDEEFSLMVKRELEHLPKDDYLKRLRSGELDMGVRREALEWIYKARAHYGFGEMCFVLAMNYFDRFLSVYELPKGKTWMVQLLAVACLSLAAKMEEIEVPLTVDLQVEEPKFIFQGENIQKMELLVLSTLNWKMQPYTPCTFIDYFFKKITGGRYPLAPLISKSLQLITSTMKGIDFLESRPSEIAAAVAMSVLGEMEAIDIDKTMPSFKQLEMGRVLKCFEMIKDLTLVSGSTLTNGASSSTSSVPQSPNAVLEASCLSYKSDDMANSSSLTSPDTKRRKPGA